MESRRCVITSLAIDFLENVNVFLKQWLCFFDTKTAYTAASPAPPAYADHMAGDG